MKRLSAWIEGVKEFKQSWSAGRDEYRKAVEMRLTLQKELERIRALQQDVQQAHSQLPGALDKIRSEVTQMGEHNKKQLELINDIKSKKGLSKEELQQMMAEMEKTKLPSMEPLTDVMDGVTKRTKKKD